LVRRPDTAATNALRDRLALLTIGPILLSAATSVRSLAPSATVRRVVHMAALAVTDAAGRMNGPTA